MGVHLLMKKSKVIEITSVVKPFGTRLETWREDQYGRIITEPKSISYKQLQAKDTMEIVQRLHKGGYKPQVREPGIWKKVDGVSVS